MQKLYIVLRYIDLPVEKTFSFTGSYNYFPLGLSNLELQSIFFKLKSPPIIKQSPNLLKIRFYFVLFFLNSEQGGQ